MPIRSAEDLFLNELKDIYSAEKQAVRAYPRLAKVVQSQQLKAAMQLHLEQTKGQIERLDRIFEQLDKRATGKTCEGMKGLLAEGAQHADEIEPGPVLDAALLGALQKVEHYEIAAYGTVVAFAQGMGESEIQQLLQQTLEEEKQTDAKLTEVSTGVNQQAMAGDEDEEEDGEKQDDAAPRKGAAKKSAAKKSAAKKSTRR